MFMIHVFDFIFQVVYGSFMADNFFFCYFELPLGLGNLVVHVVELFLQLPKRSFILGYLLLQPMNFILQLSLCSI